MTPARAISIVRPVREDHLGASTSLIVNPKKITNVATASPRSSPELVKKFSRLHHPNLLFLIQYWNTHPTIPHER